MSWPPVPKLAEDKILFYDAYTSVDKCVLAAPLHAFQSYLNVAKCNPFTDIKTLHLEKNEITFWKTIREGSDVLPAIFATVLGICFAQAICHKLPLRSTQRFFMEFLIISLPTVYSSTVTSSYNGLYCLFASLFLGFLIWRTGAWARAIATASNHCYNVGDRALVVTLMRATTYLGTSCCILAVDFEAFPKEWRKSRTYGASVMDTGIGLFVMTMGAVSQRTQNFRDLKKVAKVVVPLLVLGLARTLVITLIDYQQDDREYGRHLNAFFTLGLTKLLASLSCLLVRKDWQLVPLSIGILVFHELLLQLGVSEFVMSDVDRDGFISANREGLSALPGCVALYLFTMWCGKWYISKGKLNYLQFFAKLRKVLIVTIASWCLTISSVFSTGIARVTFNAGYVIWMFSLGITFLLFYTIIYEFIYVKSDTEEQQKLIPTPNPSPLPVVVQAINMNGLTHFMLSNFLTGFVNMALSPGERSNLECVLILMLYMLINIGIVYGLYRKGIRIA